MIGIMTVKTECPQRT